jgi:LysM domain
MTGNARIAARRPHLGSPVRPAVAVIALGAALALGGCIASVARSESPSVRSAASTGPSTAPEPSGPPGPTPIPSFVRPTPTPLPTFLAYVVRSGDSLNTIAHRFGTTGRSIAYWNRAAYPSLDPEAPSYKPNVIRVGWTLVLIPNSVVDEQTLPDPTPNPTDPSEAEPSPS